MIFGGMSPVAPLSSNWPVLLRFGAGALLSLLAAMLLVACAAWIVKRSWREEAPSARIQHVQRSLCTPVFFTPILRRWMHWELGHNPIGWLERRTWSARLVTWVWFAVFISIYLSLLTNLSVYQRSFHAIQSFLAWLLAISIAISSAGSFRRERETGLLELLVVSPLRERQIIGGRLFGLWTQFSPAIILLVAVWLYCASFLVREQNELPSILFYGSTFLTLPVIGLYQSLARTSFLAALLSTLLLDILFPQFLTRIGDYSTYVLWFFGVPWSFLQGESGGTTLFVLSQVAVAAACAWRLEQNLRNRQFALGPQIA